MKYLIFTFVLLLFNLPTAEAHQFHTTLTRLDYNAKDQTAEISVQVFTHDLENIIEQKTGKRTSLEKTPNAEKLVFEYLNEFWILKNRAGEVKKLDWVGLEAETDAAWLYFETKMPEGLESATLQNRLFFELYQDQVNLLVAKNGEQKADLAFKAGDKFKELVFKNPQ